MSRSLHTVAIGGYGPVTVRSLSHREIERAIDRGAGNNLAQLTEVLLAGCVRPDLRGMPDEAVATEFEACPDALPSIAMAIMERSWPNTGGA